MKNTCQISVIMPVYNMQEYISAAIESILAQSFVNFEFIIINDCSTDRSKDIILSYLSDSRIKLLQTTKRNGNYPARNLGVNQAVGKYICVMDADDIARHDRLKIQFQYMENHPAVLAAGTAYTLIGKTYKIHTIQKYEELKEALLLSNCFLHPSLIVRTGILKEIGGYKEEFFYSADYDLLCRLSLLGPVVNLSHTLMSYRTHSSQISTAHRTEQKRYGNKIRRTYQQIMINQLVMGTNMKSITQADIAYPEMGMAIYHAVKANKLQQSDHDQKASIFLSIIYEKATSNMPIGLENGLCGIGCGLIYLLRNGLVEGDEDEVLSEIDQTLSKVMGNIQTKDMRFMYGITGWIHYLRLRLSGSLSDTTLRSNHQTLINLIDYLDFIKQKDSPDNLNLIEELTALHQLSIYPSKINNLLAYYKEL